MPHAEMINQELRKEGKAQEKLCAGKEASPITTRRIIQMRRLKILGRFIMRGCHDTYPVPLR